MSYKFSKKGNESNKGDAEREREKERGGGCETFETRPFPRN